nr:YqgE/AlgH family protein [Vibrio vulnificus]
MKDPYFQHSVIYICEHNEEGAMGLMINAPIDITVGKMLEQVDVQPVHPQLNTSSLTKPVYNGGSQSTMAGQLLKIAASFSIDRKISMSRAYK